MTIRSTRITVRNDLYEKAIKAVKDGKFPGVRSFSGICEHALTQLFKEKGEGSK